MTQTARFDRDADNNRLVNSSAIPTFTANIARGDWVDITQFRRLNGTVLSDAPLHASHGVIIQQSFSTSPAAGSDGDADVHVQTEFSTAQSTSTARTQRYTEGGYSVEALALWARLVVVHNGVAPTVLVRQMIGAGIT